MTIFSHRSAAATTSEDRRQRRRFLRSSILCGAALFSILFAWSMASPFGSGTDEPAHVIKAAATVRNEWIGTQSTDPARPGDRTMLVQEPFASTNWKCLVRNLESSASCDIPFSSDLWVSAETAAGRYPPWYYYVVGVPSLVGHSTGTVYWMRIFANAMEAALLGLAAGATLTFSRSRLRSAALLVALSPAILSWASLVNASGLEETAGIAVWAIWLLLASNSDGDPPHSLITAGVVSACALVLARPLSPILAIGIFVTIAALYPKAPRRLWGQRRFRRGSLFVVAAMAIQFTWVVATHALLLGATASASVRARTPTWTWFTTDLGSLDGFLQQCIGRLGWQDLPPPLLTFLAWTIIGGGLWLLAVGLSTRREATVLALMLVLSIVLPLLLDVWNAHTYGLTWRSRYNLPYTAGIPLVAAALLSRHPLLERSRLPGIAAVLLGLGMYQEWWKMLGRYTVGLGHALNPFANVPGAWSPPFPPELSALLLAGATTGLAFALTRQRDAPFALEPVDRVDDPTSWPRG
jgi:Predicted membrane protein (DUF2142)